MINKHVACVSLGACLLGGLGVAQAEDSNAGSMLSLCGTTASSQTKAQSQDYVLRYMLKDLPVAVYGEGVSANKDVALVTQTEPEEKDSVYNVKGDLLQPKYNGIEPDPEPKFRQGDEPESQYQSNPEKGLHSDVALAYFSDTVSGVMSPVVIPTDNSFGVNFNTETYQQGKASKYSFALNYSRKLVKDLEFQIEWTPLAWNKDYAGFDNSTVTLKYQILKNSDNALGISGSAEFPTGTPKFSSVGVQPELKLSYSYYLPEKWSMTANLRSKLATSTSHDPTYIDVKYSLQFGKSFEKDFVALNFGGETRDYFAGHGKYYAEAFYSRTLAPDQSLSFNVRKGLTAGRRTDWKFTVGYNMTF